MTSKLHFHFARAGSEGSLLLRPSHFRPGPQQHQFDVSRSFREGRHHHLRVAGGLGVIRVQLVAEPHVVNERGGAHFHVDIADDSAISFPARVDAERQLIFTGAAWIGRKIGDRHLDGVGPLLGLAGKIKLVGNVGAHRSKFRAVHRNPPKVGDGVEVQHRRAGAGKAREAETRGGADSIPTGAVTKAPGRCHTTCRQPVAPTGRSSQPVILFRLRVLKAQKRTPPARATAQAKLSTHRACEQIFVD